MPVIGTAGHVDHGKSTLIEALTGRDPDRLAEEKERGLTIDLGFAWTDLGGIEVSFVDVPGHERFIKNMLAGTEAIDVALLVVAVDEGWMPQTEEHVAVLDLLGVSLGVIALTKTDRVDADLLELATLEVAERIAGTALESAKLVPVSAITGAGLDELRLELRSLSEQADQQRRAGDPAMWVDRSFSIDGAGTVVTGTLLGGSLTIGDTVSVWPANRSVRIRGLHSHEETHQSVGPGRRTAANLVGITRDEIGRGSLLTNLPWPTSSAFSVRLRAARYADEVGERGAYHLHMGAGSWPVELRPLSASPQPGPDERADGREMAVLLRSETPLPVRVGERFILRETGRQSVVAGGQIIDPAAPRRAAQASLAFKQLERILQVDPDEAATMLLGVRGIASLAVLAGWTAGGQPQSGLRSGDVAISAARVQKLVDGAVTSITAFHQQHPLREGMPIASLASGLDLEIDATRLVLATDQRIRDDGSSVALATFNAGLTDRQEADLAGAIKLLDGAGYNVPKLTELGLDRELLHIALREERIVRVSDDLVFLPAQLTAIQAKLGGLSSPFGVGDFKDLIGVSRKYAVPLLEYFDANGVTRRVGNDRVLR